MYSPRPSSSGEFADNTSGRGEYTATHYVELSINGRIFCTLAASGRVQGWQPSGACTGAACDWEKTRRPSCAASCRNWQIGPPAGSTSSAPWFGRADTTPRRSQNDNTAPAYSANAPSVRWVWHDGYIKTVAQIAREYSVHPVPVSQWKAVNRDRLPEVFEAGGKVGEDVQSCNVGIAVAGHHWVANMFLASFQFTLCVSRQIAG